MVVYRGYRELIVKMLKEGMRVMMGLSEIHRGMVVEGADHRWSYWVLYWWMGSFDCLEDDKEDGGYRFWLEMMVDASNGRRFRLLMLVKVLMQIGNEGLIS